MQSNYFAIGIRYTPDSGYIADNATLTLYISADEAEASLATLRTFVRADLDFKVLHLQVIGTVDTK